ncbi:MAG: hypothetical protein KGI91_00010 [Burkholderiales bacterium]|nr:hypothetical protein [Burkholderiales bacterium]
MSAVDGAIHLVLLQDACSGLDDVFAGRVVDADTVLLALQRRRVQYGARSENANKLIFVSSGYAEMHNLDINIKCKPSKS